MTPVLEVRSLVKSYGTTPVLRGVDLTVEEHRVVTLTRSSWARCSQSSGSWPRAG